MRFIKYLAITAAILGGHIDIVSGTVSPQPVNGAPVSGDEFVHDALSAGPSPAQFAAGSPGVALFVQRNLRRPGSGESIGVANIINVPHFVFAESMSAEEIRAHLSRTFAVIRNTLSRHPDLTTILINGEGSFGSLISASPAPLQETIRGMLNEVIHATFDDLAGVTIQLNNIPFVHGADGSRATYHSTSQIMGPQPLSHMGRSGRLATTLMVNVYNPSSSSQDFNALLARLIEGGLPVPEGIPDVVVGVPETSSVSASAETLLPSTEVAEESNTGDRHSGLTEEEQAQIAAAIAEFDDAQMVVPEDPEIRPADPSRVMRLIDDEDEVAPYNPSSTPQVVPPRPPAFTDLEDDTAYRRAIEESLASAHAGAGGFDEDEEEQMLAAAIESSMQRPPRSRTPEAAIDVNSIIVEWMATGSSHVSELIVRLMEAGLDPESSLAIAEQFL